MNEQPISKQNLYLNGGFSRELEVSKIFQTIQGEGPLSGRPANFIRLAGCNLKCIWCDTDYSCNEMMAVSDIMHLIDHGTKLVVITGGEPFRQNIGPLCEFLFNNGFIVQIETNGTLTNPNFPWDKVIIVCSPKTKKLNRELVSHTKYYKYVVGWEDKESLHGLPLTHTQKPSKTMVDICPPPVGSEVLYTPRDDHNEKINLKNLHAAMHLTVKFKRRINLQIHKIMNVE